MERDEAIAQALREVGLEAAYAPDVAAYLDAPDESWRSCCGGLCDPCMLVVGRAVDRARALLGAADAASGEPLRPRGELY